MCSTNAKPMLDPVCEIFSEDSSLSDGNESMNNDKTYHHGSLNLNNERYRAPEFVNLCRIGNNGMSVHEAEHVSIQNGDSYKISVSVPGMYVYVHPSTNPATRQPQPKTATQRFLVEVFPVPIFLSKALLIMPAFSVLVGGSNNGSSVITSPLNLRETAPQERPMVKTRLVIGLSLMGGTITLAVIIFCIVRWRRTERAQFDRTWDRFIASFGLRPAPVPVSHQDIDLDRRRIWDRRRNRRARQRALRHMHPEAESADTLPRYETIERHQQIYATGDEASSVAPPAYEIPANLMEQIPASPVPTTIVINNTGSSTSGPVIVVQGTQLGPMVPTVPYVPGMEPGREESESPPPNYEDTVRGFQIRGIYGRVNLPQSPPVISSVDAGTQTGSSADQHVHFRDQVNEEDGDTESSAQPVPIPAVSSVARRVVDVQVAESGSHNPVAVEIENAGEVVDGDTTDSSIHKDVEVDVASEGYDSEHDDEATTKSPERGAGQSEKQMEETSAAPPETKNKFFHSDPPNELSGNVGDDEDDEVQDDTAEKLKRVRRVAGTSNLFRMAKIQKKPSLENQKTDP